MENTMQTSTFGKLASILTLAVVFVAFSSTTAFAEHGDAEDGFEAHITIFPTLEIHNVQDLDFGQVSQPDDGETGTVEISPDGELLEDSGLAVSDFHEGYFEVTQGDPERAVRVEAEIDEPFTSDDGSAPDEAVELLGISLVEEGQYGAATIAADDWEEGDEFGIGGEVELTDEAEGDYTADFTVSAVYE